MSKVSHYFKQNWRVLLTVVTFIALIGVTYSLRQQIFETIRNLDAVNLWWIASIVLLQVGFYHYSARMYRTLFAILGHDISYKFLLRATLELTFVNHVFPSGGVTGFSYWGFYLRKQDVSAAKATLVQTMRFVLIFISFLAVLFFGLIALALDGRVNNFLLLTAGSLTTLLVSGTLFFMYVIDSKSRINNFFTFLTKAVNRLIHFVRPKHPETINVTKAKRVFDDYHENYIILKQNYKRLKGPIIDSLMINLAEVLSVYVVFLAFGQLVNPGAVILAYAVANFAGFISVVPGGAGIYEGLMIGVLAAGGVPVSLSLPVIIMYRIVSVAVQIPPGAWLYYKTVHRNT